MRNPLIRMALITAAAALIFSGCASGDKACERQVFAMDTIMTITAYGKQREEGVQAATQELYRLEALLSATDAKSAVAGINRGETVQAPDEVLEILASAMDFSHRTGGAFDITVAPVLKLWGFTTGQYRVPGGDELTAAMTRVGYGKIQIGEEGITLSEGTEIDLGGIAKGYAGDRVADILSQYGVISALIDLGGDIRAVGSKPDGEPWKIAIQSPVGEGSLGIVEVSDMAVVTSGNYERYFEGEDGTRYHHIIDPGTGYPADSGLDSVTVVCDQGIQSDALSTALFVMGLDGAVEFWRAEGGFEAVFVTEAGDIYITEGLRDIFSLPQDSVSGGFTIIPNEKL